MQKRIHDWDRAPAEWTTDGNQLHVVAKTEAAGVPPGQPAAPAKSGHTRKAANPLDRMTWEERFWYAFQAILELEHDLEELQGRQGSSI